MRGRAESRVRRRATAPRSVRTSFETWRANRPRGCRAGPWRRLPREKQPPAECWWPGADKPPQDGCIGLWACALDMRQHLPAIEARRHRERSMPTACGRGYQTPEPGVPGSVTR
jgi:hypothetical protein